MPKLWVKDAGTWKQVKQLYIKDGGVWKSPTVGLINDAGIGKQFYPDTTPTVIYSTPGTRTYTVPAGVTSLRVSYPTTSGMVNTTLAVTGGQLLNVVTGDYNVASSVGTLSIPAYSKIVFNHSAGNVDNTLTQTFTVATTNVANASTTNTNQSGSSANLNVNGIFFQTNGEGNQGDFGETVQISTVPISTLIGNYRTFGEITRSTGASTATIEQQPTAGNSWRARFTVTEFNYSNTLVTFRIIVEQQGWVQITPLNSNVITYNSPGTYTFTVPSGVTSLNVTTSGGGGAGQTSFFNSGSWTQTAGASGASTTVTNGTWTLTSAGGSGGSSTGTGGTNTITGSSSTTLNQTGGSKSGGTGGNSYYASGTAQGANFTKPATASTSAGGGAGFQFDGPANFGGSAGGTAIATFTVAPAQTITITVGAGAVGSNVNYTKGSNQGSYAGNGGSGLAIISYGFTS